METEKETTRKHRSPNYPAIGLGEAIGLARVLWTKEKRTAVDPEVVVKAWGHQSLSGTARIKLAAVKKYQLIEEDKDGVRVSPLALELLQHPEGSAEYLAAARRAALAPEIFRDLAKRFLHGSDDALKRELMFQRTFSEDGAVTAIRAFRDAVKVAKLTDSDYIPEHEKVPSPPADLLPGDPMNAAVPSTMTAPSATPSQVRMFSWPLSKDVTAEVRFAGAPVEPEHLERLRKYLELAKDAIADEAKEQKND